MYRMLYQTSPVLQTNHSSRLLLFQVTYKIPECINLWQEKDFVKALEMKIFGKIYWDCAVFEILTWEDDSAPRPHLWLALDHCWRRGRGRWRGWWSCWSSCSRHPAWPGPTSTSAWSSGTACPARPASAVQPPRETNKYFCTCMKPRIQDNY